jgi:hypothetical protein
MDLEGGEKAVDGADLDYAAGSGKKSKRKGKKGSVKEAGWCVDPNGGPPMTKAAGNFLSALLGVWNAKGRQQLDIVLAGPEADSSLPPAYDPTSTASACARLQYLDKKSKIWDLETIMALIQLAINVDRGVYPLVASFNNLPSTREIAVGSLNHEPVSKSSLAKKYTTATSQNFTDHIKWGHAFAFLAAGGTLYIVSVPSLLRNNVVGTLGILPIIAALDLRTTVTRQLNPVDIQCPGTALRQVTRKFQGFLYNIPV